MIKSHNNHDLFNSRRQPDVYRSPTNSSKLQKVELIDSSNNQELIDTIKSALRMQFRQRSIDCLSITTVTLY